MNRFKRPQGGKRQDLRALRDFIMDGRPRKFPTEYAAAGNLQVVERLHKWNATAKQKRSEAEVTFNVVDVASGKPLYQPAAWTFDKHGCRKRRSKVKRAASRVVVNVSGLEHPNLHPAGCSSDGCSPKSNAFVLPALTLLCPVNSSHARQRNWKAMRPPMTEEEHQAERMFESAFERKLKEKMSSSVHSKQVQCSAMHALLSGEFLVRLWAR